MDKAGREIWTIGHSTHPAAEFVGMLASHQIALLVDVRSFPGSRRWPQFNQDALALALREAGIDYRHMPGLGGRRRSSGISRNTAWRNESFRAYADYMDTPEFAAAATDLENAAGERRTAIMCAEALWWRCHRSLISDWLKWRGWRVLHIGGKGKAEEHPYTGAASIVDGRLSYEGGPPEQPGLFPE